MLSEALGFALLLTGRGPHADPFTFQDDFESYANDTELRAVWEPDWRITLGVEDSNHYLRAEVEEGTVMKVNVWIVPTGDLTGQDLAVDVRCTAINSGNAYFYIPGTPKDYRSVSGVALSTGMEWATLTLSNITPEDFVRFDGKSGTPDLANALGLGVTFWVDDTVGLGTQYMEVDNFAVTPEPSMLLTLGLPCLFLSTRILRRRNGSQRFATRIE